MKDMVDTSNRTRWLTAILVVALLLTETQEAAVQAGSPAPSPGAGWQTIPRPSPSIRPMGDPTGMGSGLPSVRSPAWAPGRQVSRGFDQTRSGSPSGWPQSRKQVPKATGQLDPLGKQHLQVPDAGISGETGPFYQMPQIGGVPLTDAARALAGQPADPPSGQPTPSPITGAQPQLPMPPLNAGERPSRAKKGLVLPPGTNVLLSDIEFIEQDVKDVFRLFASLIKLNIDIDPTIQGPVTLHYSNLTVEEAMNNLISSQKLAFVWSGNLLRIMRSENAPLVLKLFSLQKASAVDVKPKVESFLTPQKGKCEIDSQQNALIVTDTQNVLDQLEELLPKLDIPQAVSDVISPRTVTEVFYLDYADAAALTNPLKMIAPNAQVLSYSSNQAAQAGSAGGAGTGRQDMMIITDFQANLDRIREFVSKLDVSPIQVTIDAHIYEIDLNEEEKLGINWQKQIPIAGTTENVFDMSIAPEESTAGGTGVFRLGSLNVNQFRALLAMLKTHSFAKVLSNPVITTLNNRAANITVGQAIPYVSASQVNAQTGNVTNTVNTANANITLNVTPSVTGNDEVFLDIQPTISSVLGFTTLGGNQTPNLSNRTAQTQVIVKNNHTIVIGGMIKTDKSDTLSKVPFFGDLPGIGKLFQKKTQKESRTELIIFITPHVIRNHGSARGAGKVAGMPGESNFGSTPRLSLQP